MITGEEAETNPFRYPPPSENELLEECPPRFRVENEWLHYVRLLIYKGADISNWQYLSEDPEECKEQILRLDGIVRSRRLNNGQKEWLGCWKLSKMLRRVPDYLPLKGVRKG